MADDSGWCTIESSPAVFTEILEEIGVEGVEVEEPYSLDTSELERFGKVHGIIFLFRYRGDEQEHARSRGGTVLSAEAGTQPEDLFFANQVIQNACATQAILSIILNGKGIESKGQELNQLKEFTLGMDSMTKGLVLSNSEKLRAAHNSFVSNTLIVDEPNEDKNKKKEDAFHFVSYIPWDDRVYELDGLQKGPRDLGKCGDNGAGSWMKVVADDVAKRVREYSESEIRFGLLLVTEDQRVRIQKALGKSEKENDMSQVNELRQQLMQQNEKRELWKKENARRKWNFMPFMIKLLKLLAETGHAEKMIDTAAERKQAAYQQAVNKKASKQSQ